MRYLILAILAIALFVAPANAQCFNGLNRGFGVGGYGGAFAPGIGGGCGQQQLFAPQALYAQQAVFAQPAVYAQQAVYSQQVFAQAPAYGVGVGCAPMFAPVGGFYAQRAVFAAPVGYGAFGVGHIGGIGGVGRIGGIGGIGHVGGIGGIGGFGRPRAFGFGFGFGR